MLPLIRWSVVIKNHVDAKVFGQTYGSRAKIGQFCVFQDSYLALGGWIDFKDTGLQILQYVKYTK